MGFFKKTIKGIKRKYYQRAKLKAIESKARYKESKKQAWRVGKEKARIQASEEIKAERTRTKKRSSGGGGFQAFLNSLPSGERVNDVVGGGFTTTSATPTKKGGRKKKEVDINAAINRMI